MRILVTSSTYQDAPGQHVRMLAESGHDIVYDRGPLNEVAMLRHLTCNLHGDGGFDAVLHGNDKITRKVIETAVPQLTCLSKYGVGVDNVDVVAATEHGIAVLNTPSVNQVSVAEHVMGLIITLAKHLHLHIDRTNCGRWERAFETELAGRTLGILGLGATGKAVAQRARAFDMRVLAYDVFWDERFAAEHGIERAHSVGEPIHEADFLTLHLHLTDTSRHFLDERLINTMKDGAHLINCARGGLVDEQAVADACANGSLAGYAADVLEHEPLTHDHPFCDLPNVILTPHIAARTHQSAQRQALMATENLLRYLAGGQPHACVNPSLALEVSEP